ncbi:MAG: bifunctional demethylmenaquinone methyltransferase/2-methoxy-6-polyprenyl-1,4-benzoquinol methylase UbiE [Bacteroidales bacterium]|nr:bifunctional demethylmenaquinone methyltransferase/2-methoxy-6-polyprenyl-1,4-benzoquinol methylase UbiE [Bacteroidales bacterium]
MTKKTFSPQSDKVGQMFDSISHKYDFLNHFLSMGIDKAWRKKLISELKKHNPAKVLDVATGTADLAIQLSRNSDCIIHGIDISEMMLEEGQKKITQQKLKNRIQLIQAAAEKIPFDANEYDAAMAAFGVRNFYHLLTGLLEMHRVLKPDGWIYILEFSKPKTFAVRQIYQFYFRFILPLAGGLISGNFEAYRYLPRTVNAFPDGQNFLKIMQDAGFTQTTEHSLSFGIATLYIGKKEAV